MRTETAVAVPRSCKERPVRAVRTVLGIPVYWPKITPEKPVQLDYRDVFGAPIPPSKRPSSYNTPAQTIISLKDGGYHYSRYSESVTLTREQLKARKITGRTEGGWKVKVGHIL